MKNDYSRVEITSEATKLLDRVKDKHGKNLIFHQSGGCCDGSSPMVFNRDDMYLDSSDVLIGNVADIDFFMNHEQFEYWKHTHITIDVTEGRGSSFSLEIPFGYRFIIQSRLFTDEEQKHFGLID